MPWFIVQLVSRKILQVARAFFNFDIPSHKLTCDLSSVQSNHSFIIDSYYMYKCNLKHFFHETNCNQNRACDMVSCNLQLFFRSKSCARNGSVWHGLKIKVHVLYAFILVLILVYNYISFLSKLIIIKDCLYCTVPALAPMPAPATKHPSINLCGSFRMISLSLHVPGSPSSALTTRYLGLHKPITV